jgi:hypothetical protein
MKVRGSLTTGGPGVCRAQETREAVAPLGLHQSCQHSFEEPSQGPGVCKQNQGGLTAGKSNLIFRVVQKILLAIRFWNFYTISGCMAIGFADGALHP